MALFCVPLETDIDYWKRSAKMRDDLLLIKGHFFFLFAGKYFPLLYARFRYIIGVCVYVCANLWNLLFSALGPILPFISVIGKQLGISEVAMGSIFAVMPILFFVMKPVYGFIVDYFVKQRTFIFTLTVALMGISYLLIYFVPKTPLQRKAPTYNVTCLSVLLCDLHVSACLVPSFPLALREWKYVF